MGLLNFNSNKAKEITYSRSIENGDYTYYRRKNGVKKPVPRDKVPEEVLEAIEGCHNESDDPYDMPEESPNSGLLAQITVPQKFRVKDKAYRWWFWLPCILYALALVAALWSVVDLLIKQQWFDFGIVLFFTIMLFFLAFMTTAKKYKEGGCHFDVEKNTLRVFHRKKLTGELDVSEVSRVIFLAERSRRYSEPLPRMRVVGVQNNPIAELHISKNDYLILKKYFLLNDVFVNDQYRKT